MTPCADIDITEITADTAAESFFASAEEIFLRFGESKRNVDFNRCLALVI